MDLRAQGSDLLLDDVHDSRLSERRQVAELVALACDDLAHDATHDLARASLGQIGYNINLLRRREGTDNLANLEDEFLGEGGFVSGLVLEFWLQGDEGTDGLTVSSLAVLITS